MIRQNNKDPITSVCARILRIPTIRAHKLSVATMREQRTVILEVKTATGLTGLGEAATIGGLAYSDESPESIQLTLEKYFGPILVGQDSKTIGGLLEQVNRAAVGNYFAKMAVETALLDLLGQHVGLPVSELVGGRRRNSLEVIWTLASGDTAQDIEEGIRVLDANRHRHFKLKIGKRHWRQDVDHCQTIAEHFKGAATVRVDVNQAWDYSIAKLAIPALSEAGVILAEQPLPGQDVSGAHLLRSVPGIAIMADEALRGGPSAAFDLACHQAADVFSLKIAQAGGLFACRAVAEIAQAAGISLYGGTMLEGPIATMASAHVFTTLPDLSWGSELFGPLLLTNEFLNESLRYEGFSLQIPDRPGLGVSLNEDAVAEFEEPKG